MRRAVAVPLSSVGRSASGLRRGRPRRLWLNPGDLGDQLERAQPRGVIVDIGHDDQLVGLGFLDQRVDPGANRVGRADDGAREHAHRLRLFHWRPIGVDVIDRRLAQAARAAEDIRERHLLRRREAPRLRVAVGGDDVDADHGIGPVKLFGGLEASAIDLQRRNELVGSEVRSEGVRQAELGGQHRAELARSENPERHLRSRRRHGLDALVRTGRRQEGLQFQNVLREVVGRLGERRKARSVSWSVPGARPRPRSMRPGNNRASVPNCSAMT